MLPYCHISIGGMVTFPFNHHHHPSVTIADIPQYWQWFYCWCLPLLMLLTPMPLTAFTNNPHPHQEPWHQQPHESIHAMYMAMTWWTQVYHYILPFLPFTLNPGAMSLSAMYQPRGWDWRVLKHSTSSSMYFESSNFGWVSKSTLSVFSHVYALIRVVPSSRSWINIELSVLL